MAAVTEAASRTPLVGTAEAQVPSRGEGLTVRGRTRAAVCPNEMPS